MSLLSFLGEIVLFKQIFKLLGFKREHDSESTTVSDSRPIIIDEPENDYLSEISDEELIELASYQMDNSSDDQSDDDSYDYYDIGSYSHDYDDDDVVDTYIDHEYFDDL